MLPAEETAPADRAWSPRSELGPISYWQPAVNATPPTKSPSWSVERWFLRKMLSELDLSQVELRLWDGQVICKDQPGDALYRLTIAHRRALWQMLWNPEYDFPEGYSCGSLKIEGDLLAFLCELNKKWRHHPPRRLTAWLRQRRAIRRRSSQIASLRNVERHYDLGNDFYRLWLDEQLVYTCAYFSRPGMSLEAAQIAKLDHVCRKLRLKPGETVIEAGCGWGALALHMARYYGVRVKACNVSVEQLQHARQRAAQLGLTDRVEFVNEDWRNLTGSCQAFVSIGMLEHVGPENFSQLAQVINRCLSPDGRGLIHTIGQNFPIPLNPWIEQQIFPGAEPPSLAQLAQLFSAGDLSVLDIENLRLHYAETLWHWLDRFEKSAEAISRNYGDTFLRRWRLYLAMSYSAFETGGLQLYQVVFTPAASNHWHRSRADWYAETSSRLEASE